MAAAGFSAAAAERILAPVEAGERIQVNGPAPDAAIVEGTGGDRVVARAKAESSRHQELKLPRQRTRPV